MIELRGEKVVLRTMEREHCRTLWEHYLVLMLNLG